jgi:hypothetical protein
MDEEIATYAKGLIAAYVRAAEFNFLRPFACAPSACSPAPNPP